jgi:hypothetical protein
MKPTKAHSSQEGQRRPTKRKQGPNDASGVVWALGVFFLIFFIRFTDNRGPKRRRHVVCLGRFIGSASICPPPPPTSLDDSLVASPASICPIPPPTSPRDSLDGSPGLHLPYTRPPSGLHHHQRVLATRWTVSPASFRLPTTTNESRRLVGRFPGLHLPFHHHQRCSLGFHQGYFIV